MALMEPTLTMQVLADENLLAIIMDNVDDLHTLYDLVLALPTAKAIFERCPRQRLMAALSSLPSELRLLVVLYIALKQDNVTRASTIPLLWGYLQRHGTPRFVEPPVGTVDLEMPKIFSNPIETLRKLAAVSSAVEYLAGDFIERSIKFIEECEAAEAACLQKVHYGRGRNFRPLSHLWNRSYEIEEIDGYGPGDKPQPWSLPLKASEIDRVKRTLWRFHIFAVVSYVAPPSPNESAIDSKISKNYPAGAIDIAMPPDDDEGACMLLASLYGFELAELDSVHDYLVRETVGKAYQHMLDASMAQHDKKVQPLQSEGEPETTSHGSKPSEQKHEKFRAQYMRTLDADKIIKDHDRHLTYFMSLGLPFLHRVHLQLKQDGNLIVPEHYPPLRYQSWSGLRDMWNGMDRCGRDKIQVSYKRTLIHEEDETTVDRQESAPPASCALYLQSLSLEHFRVEDLWRAGCYMWDRGRSVQRTDTDFVEA